MTTFVEITQNDPHGEYSVGDRGYVIGFTRGADDHPYVAVASKQRIVLVPTYGVKITAVGNALEVAKVKGEQA